MRPILRLRPITREDRCHNCHRPRSLSVIDQNSREFCKSCGRPLPLSSGSGWRPKRISDAPNTNRCSELSHVATGCGDDGKRYDLLRHDPSGREFLLEGYDDE